MCRSRNSTHLLLLCLVLDIRVNGKYYTDAEQWDQNEEKGILGKESREDQNHTTDFEQDASQFMCLFPNGIGAQCPGRSDANEPILFHMLQDNAQEIEQSTNKNRNYKVRIDFYPYVPKQAPYVHYNHDQVEKDDEAIVVINKLHDIAP
jgi:hypothetical protein